MDSKHFAYVSFTILIAIYIGVHLSSAPAEAERTRCPIVSRWGLTCTLGGWIYDNDHAGHVGICSPCRAYYWYCHMDSRRRHAAHSTPRPLPTVPTPTRTTTQTTRQTTSQTTSQSQSQTPQRESPPRRQQPQQSCKKPTLHFKTWTVGGPDGRVTAKDTSFITNTETTCKVYAEVTYNGSQPPNTCEITGATWTVIMSHDFTVDTATVDTDTEGSGFSKVWTYETTLTGPEMRTPKGWDCDEEWLPSGPNNSDKKEYAGRNQQRMSLTINFSGSYSGGTAEVSQLLSQSTKDGIRQEYVDYNLNVIPDRADFRGDSNIRYNWGHYPAWAIDKDLEGRHAEWAKWVDPTFTTADLELSSGYRHPYHNFYCVEATAVHGLHHYGLALDVSADLDNSGSASNAEKVRVETAARRAGVNKRHIFRYGDTKHIHADWRPTDWRTRRNTPNSTIGTPGSVVPAPDPPSNNGGSDDDDDEDEDDGADSGTSTDTAPAAPAAPTPTTVACARGSSCSLGGRVSSANAHRRTCLGGHTYWICHSSRLGYGNEYHRTRTCQRTGCGVSSSRCLNGSSRSPCTGTGRNYRYHNLGD